MSSISIASLTTQFIKQEGRSQAARTLARRLGAHDLIIFIRDPEIDVLLPAPGFAQTLPAGRVWRRFLQECAALGYHRGVLPYPEKDLPCPAVGITAEDGSVLVLLGGEPDRAAVEEVCTLVPLLAAAFHGERLVANAEGQVELAQQSAAKARALASALDVVRQELQVALHVRDQFLSIAAHELKTPLTSLLGYLQVFKRRAAREAYINDRDQATLATIELQAQRLQRMVRDLFDLSRIETNVLTIEKAPLDLTLLCKRLLQEVQPILERHTVELRAEPSVTVEGDYTRLEQVLQNLLDNAVKYSPEGGAIVVEVALKGNLACMSVTDNGIGIPDESRPYLFERFYRASNVNGKNISGLGIGLFLVHEIVAAHDGTVEIASRVGEGTTFTICLPQSTDTASTPPYGLHFSTNVQSGPFRAGEKGELAHSNH